MSRFLSQRPYLSGKVGQLPQVRDAITRRELLGPNDVEPAMGSPDAAISLPIYLPDGTRRWEELDNIRAQLAALTKSLFSFPDVAQGMQLDFINQSYSITDPDGVPVPQGFSDIARIGRQTPALRVGPNGTFDWQEPAKPRIEFNPVSGVASGVRVSPGGVNLQPVSNDFAGARADVSYAGVAGAAVSEPGLAGLNGPADPGAAWEITANASTGDAINWIEVATISMTVPLSWSIYYKAMSAATRYVAWLIGGTVGIVFDTSSLTASFTQGTGTTFGQTVPFIEQAPGGYVRLGVRNIG
ncbi:MAG: hypothetical protein L0G27_08195, partial [Paracoccus sp. (in: a-proteobacteria)]|nr:hypothetical protein [Paracoccus sp. (in: a-proteobacteria)]